jgi:hypothetical protein
LAILLLAMASPLAQAQVPSNDNFANAVTLSGNSGTASGSNVNATREIGEPTAGGAYSVWWRWTAGSSATATFDTVGSSFDTYLAVYTGTSLSSLTLVDSNDDGAGNGMSRLSFAAVSGTTYQVAVSGFGTSSGNIQLNWQLLIPPANDNFSNAITLSGNSGGVTGTNVGAGTETGEHPSGGPASVWWRWTAPSAGEAVFDTAGSDFDTYLAAYTGSSVSALTLLVSNDDAGGGVLSSRVAFTAVAGTVYSIGVTGLGERTGNIRLNWQFTSSTTPPPPPPSGTTITWQSWRHRDAENNHVPYRGTNNWTTSAGTLSFSDRGNNSYIEDFVESAETFAVDGIRIEWEMRATIGTMLGYVGPYVLLVQDSGSGWNSTSIGAQVFYRWESAGTNGAVLHAGRVGNPVITTNPVVPGMNDGTFARHVVTVSNRVVTWSVNGQTLATSDIGTAAYSPMRLMVGARLYDSGLTQTIDIRNLTVTAGSTTTQGPSNDNFSNAIALTASSGTTSGTNVGATRETGEPQAGGLGTTSVWWRWTAPATGTTTFDTVGSSFDTYLSVYTGSSLSALSLIDQDDDGGGSLTSRVTFPAVANTVYYIAVTGFHEITGTIQLNWQMTTAADTTGPSLTITSHTTGQNVSTASITVSGTATDSGRGNSGISSVSVNGARATGDTATGAGIANWTRTFTLTSGANTITVVARDGSSGQNSTTQTITVTYTAATSNNNFSSAATMSGNAGSISGSNLGANNETGEPVAGGGGSNSVWWRWTPSSSGSATIDTIGSDFDTYLSVYTGTSLSALTLVAQDDDSGGSLMSRVTFSAVSSQTYFVAVTGFNSGSGNIRLNWQVSGSDSSGPILSITSHSNEQTVSASSITVSGTATDSGRGDTGISSVTVNGSRANGDTATGSGTANWSRSLSLVEGSNTITVVAKDNSSAQNSTTQTLTIFYSASTSSFRYSINDKGLFSSTVVSNAGVTVGYGRIQPDRGSTPLGLAIFGFRQTGVFGFGQDGVLVSEAAVTASSLIRSGRIYAEQSGTVQTGVAIANPNPQPVNVTFVLRDSVRGVVAAQGSTTIPANGQIAGFLNQPPFSGPSSLVGTFSFTASEAVGVAALRGLVNERGEFLISTMPVTDLAATPGSGTVDVSHFADGGGWRTQLVLFNPTDNALKGSYNWWDGGGASIPVDLSGPFCASGCTGASQYIYNIPAREAMYVRTNGPTSSSRSGRISITPDSGQSVPTAFAIFSFNSGSATVTEASVQAMAAGRAFRLYAENATGIQTGLAVSAGSAGAVVNLSLTATDGSATGLAGTITVPPNGRVATFLNQIPGFTSIASPFKGVLRVSSSASFAVVGLRGRYNERGDFLITTTAPTSESAPATSVEAVFPHFAVGGGYSTQLILISGSGAQGGTIRLIDQSGNPMNVTISQPQQPDTFSGPFSATFPSFSTVDQTCRFTPAISGTMTLTLTTNADGTLSGSAQLNSAVTAAASPSSCTFFSSSPVIEGQVSGTAENLTGMFFDSGQRPFHVRFTGRRTGDTINAAMDIMRVFATVDLSTGAESGFTELSVSIANVVLRRQ